MSSENPGASWIKTPWFKPGNGNITFKTKLENASGTSGGSYKAVRLRFIAFDANQPFGEGAFLADTFQYVYTSPFTSAVTVSFALPSAIANSEAPYKLMISFLGTGGNNRAHIDDLVIPGTYWTDPANNCFPLSVEQDADNDGVADADDDYPNDPHRAFNNPYPSSGNSTLLFEDLWPNTGDYDMNDLVLDYNFNTITDTDNEVVEIEYNFNIRAVGASTGNGFMFQLDGIAAQKVTGITHSAPPAAAWLSLNTNGTEAGQEDVNIPVIANAKQPFPLASAGQFVNVMPDEPAFPHHTVTVTVRFKENGVPGPLGAVGFNELNPSRFNPYLVVAQDRGKEVHLANRKPSNKMNTGYFGQGQDNSQPDANRYFVNTANLPWALNVYNALPNLIEKQDFTQGYLKFSAWAQSGGNQFPDWYLDLPGYRNATVLIFR